jgi:hypothetical protein
MYARALRALDPTSSYGAYAPPESKLVRLKSKTYRTKKKEKKTHIDGCFEKKIRDKTPESCYRFK